MCVNSTGLNDQDYSSFHHLQQNDINIDTFATCIVLIKFQILFN